jgi:2-oxoisovalerate ferredoxin oxidoreductase beta subunit
MVKNIVALGALQAATALFPPDTFLTSIRQALADKPMLAPINELAFARGREAALGEGERIAS